MSDDTCPIISTYTRSQALADGMLIDISLTAETVGFKYPMAVTSNLAVTLGGPGKLFWTLYKFLQKIHDSPDSSDIIKCQVDGEEIWLQLGPGDNGEPVLTLMKPEDW